MPRRIQRYAQRLGIYFWPSVEADALVLEVFKAIPSQERPQDVFRRAVLLGLRQMAASGELPERVMRHNRIGERLSRHLPPAFTAPAPGAGYAPAPQPALPVHVPVSPAYVPASQDAAMTFEDAPDEAFDMDAMIAMMGPSEPSTREEAPAG